LPGIIDDPHYTGADKDALWIWKKIFEGFVTQVLNILISSDTKLYKLPMILPMLRLPSKHATLKRRRILVAFGRILVATKNQRQNDVAILTVAKMTKNQRQSDVAILTVTKMTKYQRQSDVAFLTSLKRPKMVTIQF